MELRVRVGASKDASFDAVFRSYTDTARAANAMVTADDRRHTKLQEKLLLDKLKVSRDIAKAEMAETKAIHENERRMLAQSVAQRSRVRMQAIESESKKELAIATETAKAKAAIEITQAKEVARREREIAVAESKAKVRDAESQEKGPGRFARRTGYSAMRNIFPVVPMLSYAGRMAQDVASGAGVDFGMGSNMSNHFSASKVATDISNSGYLAGDARNGQRVASGDLMKDALKAGNAGAYSQGEALAGLQNFTGISGDLATGREVLRDMAELSRATGSNLSDVMDAAGNAANALGDMKDKGTALNAIMAAVAGQGKLGAVELRDAAVGMARLAAAAPKFAGNVKDNIILMGAFAQEARLRGGASSARESFTSVGSMTNTFSKNARVKAFAAEGINVLDKKSGLIRNPQELLMEALQKTGGGQVRMGKLFADAQARRSVSGFENIFHQTGGGEAGLKAVTAEFDRLKKAAISEEEKRESLARAMAEDTAKAQLFQNQIQEVVGAMADKLIPTLTALAPKAIQLTEAFTKIVSWAAGNPLEAIPVLLAAGIAKAGIENVVRSGVEKLFANVGLAGGLAITAALITVSAAEGLVQFMKERKEGASDRVGGLLGGLSKSEEKVRAAQGELGQAEAAGDQGKIEAAKKHVDTAKEELTRSLDLVQGQVDQTKKGGPAPSPLDVGGQVIHLANSVHDPGGTALNDEMLARMTDLTGALEKAHQILSGGGVIKVSVQDMPIQPRQGPGPGIDPSTRSGPFAPNP